MGTKRRPRSTTQRGPRSRCRYCGGAIYWLTCIRADGSRGSKAPIDIEVAFNGNVEVDVAAELYRVVPKAEAEAHREASDAGTPPRLHLNHFVTCTNLTYRKLRGRVHAPTVEDVEDEKAWEADAAGDAVPRETPLPPVDEIPLPRPGEFLVDPEEADGEPDE